MSNESERAAFEAKFSVPHGVEWDGEQYVVRDGYDRSYRCDRFVGQWAAWQACAASTSQSAAERAAWPDEIIDYLQASFDTEGITENDSGDALIRLSSAIAAVEEVAESRAASASEAGAEGAKDSHLALIMERDEWRAAMQKLCTVWCITPDAAADHLRQRLKSRAPAQAAESVSAPDGWKLVPIQPTGVMKYAGHYSLPVGVGGPWTAAAVYRAMIGQSPQPPAQADARGGLTDAARDVLAERCRQVEAEKTNFIALWNDAIRSMCWTEPRAEVAEEQPSLTNPLTPYGMLVRALRIVAQTSLYDMGQALLLSPAKLSAMEFGREPVTPEIVREVGTYFESLGVHNMRPALQFAADGARANGPLFEDSDERDEFLRACQDFDEDGETDVGYDLLMKWANDGLLDCDHFTITQEGRRTINAARAGEAS